jgi:hypothetical protein
MIMMEYVLNKSILLSVSACPELKFLDVLEETKA